VVRAQIQYGQRHHVPWGISESAYHVVDPHGSYQYKAFGVPGLEVVEGEAPEVLGSLPKPDAIFIGGGANDALDAARSMLRGGGRLVVNAVTLETEALLLARHATLGGELVRLAITRADAIGGKTGWRPAMPVTQWTWVKP